MLFNREVCKEQQVYFNYYKLLFPILVGYGVFVIFPIQYIIAPIVIIIYCLVTIKYHNKIKSTKIYY